MKPPKVQLSDSSVSRRALLLGVGGGLASSLLLSNEMASALVTQPTGSPVANPEAVRTAFNYFRARANVKYGGTSADLLKFFRPDAKGVIDFEQTRFGDLASLGAANRWNGVIDRVTSEPQLVGSEQSGTSVRLLINDWTAISWRPAPPLIPIERTPEQWAIVRKDPVRYGLNVPPWTPTNSGFGTMHLITLENVNGQWLVTKDGYNEGILGGMSPDYSAILESQAISQTFLSSRSTSLRAKIQSPRQNPPASANLTSHIFDYQAAAAYAIYWARSFNPAYSDLTSSGGDCANFVSQCFTAGGYPTDSTWYKYSPAWANNVNLRSWLISSGRGYNESVPAMLGLADVVNYDWTANGSFDHIAIVSSFSSGIPQISCHTAAQLNVPYDAIYYSGYMPNQIREYAGTNITYYA